MVSEKGGFRALAFSSSGLKRRDILLFAIDADEGCLINTQRKDPSQTDVFCLLALLNRPCYEGPIKAETSGLFAFKGVSLP